ncbi:DNA polymerase III subunit alpha [Mesoterricola silvestris]|uniref:DNA polymerase III subunit alpha n=1 Tax=Mesoterricola silvestris TaxID=2927979 RepID=A0AA48K7Y7_9BACT|nr:DNA polymerase III subunit alpha [Mesoterricola silvestris]BDU71661.1 DNA-directed DNA polymerase [Mesoterricola silvestris]
MNFAHLHLHTEYSLLDGLTRISDLVKKCKATGMNSVAVTDHGNMFGMMKLFDACEKTADKDGNWAVKPILGCEVYVAPRSRHDRKLDNAALNAEGLEDCVDPSGQRDAGYHLVLLAKNPVGFRNLSNLVSKGFTEGFYYKPRVDKELLRENSEGLIALTACLGGEVQARLLSGNIDAAERVARDYQSMFGEDFYLEIQDQGFEAERLIIPSQFELARRTGIPLVATNDAHYLNHDDADLHDTLLCIGTKRFKSEPKRMRFSTDQFYVKSPEEMAAVFPDHPELLERTLEIASKIDLFPITRKPITPQFPVPSGHTLESYFVQVARETFEERLKECRILWQAGALKHSEEKYRARLEFELDTILKMGFPGYFLLVWDFIRKAREMGVPVGPGRGSAAGSIVAWSMHITDIDPMQYDLLFERFLNPERISMPDVDIDFCRDGRQKVIDYVTEAYGKDRVSNIVTINQLKTKAVIKDVARVFEKDFAFANNLTKLVPQEPGKPITVAQALEQSDKLRELYDSEPEVKNILDISARLEGLARNTGVHAAGVIIAPDDLTRFAPLSRDKDGKVMVQYTMTEAERAGLLKMDFLGLETLTQIAKTQGYIAKTQGHPVDMTLIRAFDDKKTFDLFTQGDTDGIFQFESGGMKSLLGKLRPDRFDDLIALNALFRPGPLGAGMGDTYVNRRHGREPVTYMFPTLEPILSPTYGVILYQEQVMQIASLIAGYSLGEADMLRRAMGKKDKEKMAKEKTKFIEQGVLRGYERDKVSELFDLIEYFAGYGFNKSHSAAYALVAYETAYLKANFRTEFMAGLLSTKAQRTDDVVKYIQNCKEMGLEVLGPDINESQLDFTITGPSQIRFGFAAVKGLGDAALEAILAARAEEGGFKDFFHALKATDLQKANRRVWESLIKAGAFDSMEPNRAALMEGLPSALENAGKGGQDLGLVSLFDEAEMASLADNWAVPEDVEFWSRKDRLRYERESLGLYVSGHPLEEFKDAIKVHTVGTIASLKEAAAAGRHRDREEVSIGVMVSNVQFKTNQKGEPWAILYLEDLTDKVEALLMAGSYNPATRKRGRPFELFRHLALPDALLRVTGELKIETTGNNGEEDEEEQTTIKLFVTSLEPLEDFQGKGFSGALIRLPRGEYPSRLVPLLRLYHGNLPLHLEYRGPQGILARVRASGELNVRFDPDLSEKVAKEAGCALSWTY